MKKITVEEYQKLSLKGRGRSSAVFNHIYSLKPGEILEIDKADLRKKYSPSRITSYIRKRYARKFTCESHLDGSGWVVRRVE